MWRKPKREKWIPCDFDCLNCPRPDCDAPARAISCGRRVGEMTEAIQKALSPNAYERERERRTWLFEQAYFERIGKEIKKMTKEKFDNLTPEQQEEHRQRQREYNREYYKKNLAKKQPPAFAEGSEGFGGIAEKEAKAPPKPKQAKSSEKVKAPTEKATTAKAAVPSEGDAVSTQIPTPFLFHVQDKNGSEIHVLDVMRTVSIISGEKKYIIVVDTTEK